MKLSDWDAIRRIRDQIPEHVREQIREYEKVMRMMDYASCGILQSVSAKQPHPGITVREQRKQLGWSQAKLAKKAGCARHTLSDLEREKKTPSAAILQAILGALHKR